MRCTFISQLRLSLFLSLSLLFLALAAPANSQNLDFSLPSLQQRPIKLADFRGRWVIINFWATWCTPCLLEMPELQAFHEQHANRATVIGVNYQSLAPSEVRAFTERLKIDFPIALGNGNPIAGFPLKGLPTTFIVSPTGKLIDTHLGMVNAAMLSERLAELEKATSDKP